MTSSMMLVSFLVVVVSVDAIKKCKWWRDAHECDLDVVTLKSKAAIPGEYGRFLDYEKKDRDCIALSGTKGTCEANTDCYYNPTSSRCQYKDGHKKYEATFSDLSGCDETYKNMYDFSKRSCESYFTELACEAAGSPCWWLSNQDYDASLETTTYYYDDFSDKCLARKPDNAIAGKCLTDGVAKMCDGKTKDDVTPFTYLEGNLSKCRTSNDVAAFKECMAAAPSCAAVVDDAFVLAYRKSERTADEWITVLTANNNCLAVFTCPLYANGRSPILKKVDLPDKDCWANTDEATCEAQGNCFWVPADTECIKTSSIRSLYEKGTAECVLTIENGHFTSDALMKQAYRSKIADDKVKNENQMSCSSLTEAACNSNAACELKPHTPISCTADGTWIGNTKTECAANKTAEKAKEKVQDKKIMEALFGAAVAAVAVQIGETCKVLKTEAECTSAVYSAADDANIQTLMDAPAQSTANDADAVLNYPVVSWLLASCVIAFAN